MRTSSRCLLTWARGSDSDLCRRYPGVRAPCGLEEARAVVGIPVIGAGSAAAAAALAYCGRVGVLGLKSPVPAPISSALVERMILLDGSDGVEISDGFLLPTGILGSPSGA